MRLINSYRRRAHEQMYANEAATAQTLFTHFCTHANFIAGITVYLACGDSTKTAPITLSSAKPELHALFLPFLQQYLGVDLSSVKYVLTIPEDATESEVKKRWRPYLFRPAKAAFYPTQRVSTKAQHTSPMGSVRIIVSDRARKARLLTWCDLLTHKRSDSELTSRQK